MSRYISNLLIRHNWSKKNSLNKSWGNRQCSFHFLCLEVPDVVSLVAFLSTFSAEVEDGSREKFLSFLFHILQVNIADYLRNNFFLWDWNKRDNGCSFYNRSKRHSPGNHPGLEKSNICSFDAYQLFGNNIQSCWLDRNQCSFLNYCLDNHRGVPHHQWLRQPDNNLWGRTNEVNNRYFRDYGQVLLGAVLVSSNLQIVQKRYDWNQNPFHNHLETNHHPTKFFDHKQEILFQESKEIWFLFLIYHSFSCKVFVRFSMKVVVSVVRQVRGWGQG